MLRVAWWGRALGASLASGQGASVAGTPQTMMATITCARRSCGLTTAAAHAPIADGLSPCSAALTSAPSPVFARALATASVGSSRSICRGQQQPALLSAAASTTAATPARTPAFARALATASAASICRGQQQLALSSAAAVTTAPTPARSLAFARALATASVAGIGGVQQQPALSSAAAVTTTPMPTCPPAFARGLAAAAAGSSGWQQHTASTRAPSVPSAAHGAEVYRSPGARRAASTFSSVNEAEGHVNAHYDVIVIGTGAYGSAAAYHLAKAGATTLALDMHPPGHALGSSHGGSRITRLAYFEGPEYVKLIRRSLDLVTALEAETSSELFVRTGVLDVGATFEGAKASADAFGLRHEVLTGKQVNARFPGYGVPDGMPALFQPDGGLLCPERIIQAHCHLAARHGANLLFGDRVVGWRALGTRAGVEVTMASGARHVADQLVVSAGAWMGQLVPQAKALCVPERQVVGWFDVPTEQFNRDAFPVFIVGERADGVCYYGFPKYGEPHGLKIGCSHQFDPLARLATAPADPDALRRGLTLADEAALRAGLAAFFPSAATGKLLGHSVCMYTNTPDGHFIIDRHPAHEQVILASACSGHGFKMSPGVGQLLVDMVVTGGRGGDEAQAELRPHWFSADRPGHAAFLEACAAATA
ncbi:hypothetical protein FOA52_005196 [Chlamydomonas sp. UWO 241]|nr:hypothetical protein FOA52_005196 [Chlamydomonas sp. UWO 241]